MSLSGIEHRQAVSVEEFSGANVKPASFIERVLAAIRSIRVTRRTKSLRICETLALGERRQIVVVEWETRRYLIGATPQGLSLLDRTAESLSETARDAEASPHRQTDGPGVRR